MTDAELSEIETDAKRIDISWHVAMQLVAEVRRLREIEKAAKGCIETYATGDANDACRAIDSLASALNPGAAP